MDPKHTGEAYDQITSRWTREEYNLEYAIPQHKRALQFSKPRNATKYALDVGCGCTGRIMQLLQDHGFIPEGLDVSAEMIRLARQKQPLLSFYHEDIVAWQPVRHYDFITAWDSIWHLPLAKQEPVLSKLLDMLNPSGILLFSFGGVDQPGEHQNNAMGPTVNYSSLGTNGFLSLLMQKGATIRHMEFDQYPELHCYLIAEKS